MVYKIQTTSTFRKDFTDAFDYIKDYLKNYSAATRLRDLTIKKFDSLRTIAAACKRISISKSVEYRICPCENFIIVFSIEENVVVLYHFLYARSDIYNRLKDKSDE